uniref:Plus3 domain-containing protein n=1 Tax=Meloidogyne incognita TaxID=6306 RepID=A0A914LWZ9_MELIC
MSDYDYDDEYEDEQHEEVRHIEDLEPVVLSRGKLIRLAEKSPDKFDDLARKCFVRILTKTDKATFHSIYRILGVVDTEVPIGKSKYSKRLKVDNRSERTLECIASEPITEDEFYGWMNNAREKEEIIPTISWVKHRAAEIRSALYGSTSNRKSKGRDDDIEEGEIGPSRKKSKN